MRLKKRLESGCYTSIMGSFLKYIPGLQRLELYPTVSLQTTVPWCPPLEAVQSQPSKRINQNSRTKHMVTGWLVEESDRDPVQVEGGMIESVEEFPYLGSLLADSGGRIDSEVDGPGVQGHMVL